jgi:YD repeat-containing protein
VENTWQTTLFGYGASGAAAGVLSSVTDVNNAITSYGNFACNGVLPGSTTYPLSSVGSDSQAWDCSGGVRTSYKDVNGETTTYSYTANGADPLYRLKQITHADGGTISYAYNTGASLPWNVTTTVAVNSTESASSENILDGLGRVVQSQNLADPGGIDYVATTYNKLGQVYTVSNSYRTTTDPTYGLFTYGYDALGRVTSINQPDNSNIYRTYSNRAIEVQQYPAQMNKETIYQSDGLGRLQYVCEVTGVTQQGSQGSPTSCGLDIAGSGFETAYTYDALGNVLATTNSTNNRTFTYDGLSRLTSSIEPELNQNAVQYSYDTQMAGDLYRRIAPAPNQSGTTTVTTTYTHDTLHRFTAVTYSDGSTPWTTLAYDQSSNWTSNISNGKGRLTGAFVCPSGTSGPTCGTTNPSTIGTIFSYDPVGRVQ